VATNLEKLRSLLQELFQLDQADLDFGIYRIMNTKRDEVVRFLDKDLLPQVKEAFGQYKSADKSVLQGELDKLMASVENAGMNPDESPKVKELRQRLAESAVDVMALENEVFSHLFNFFRRYYSEGDFLSLRRYKEGVYAIPYEGEEVKLHWANADQYYVKSSETFRDYTFKIAGGKRVRVHLVAASTEQDNNKAAPGKDRRFVLAENPLSEENGELFIRFEYRQHDGKEKQDDLNKQAINAVLKTPGFEQWAQELGKLAPTDKSRDRTVLEKHLTQYTARNTFDYFIHKDLGGFLRRELDFYIKNEVMHLDDIEHESVPKVEQYLSQIKVIRSIAHKIIRFLEQLENFQKKLWLKKKFVIETNYCITLDRVPEELYPEIAKNDAQREEWVRLFAIDEIKKDLNGPGYSKPLKVEFLKANKSLILDTRFFSHPFRDQLLTGIDGLDEASSMTLINSDNFHGLGLLEHKYAGRLACVYIDPPYNTDASAILYKNDYKNSSWLSLIEARCRQAQQLLVQEGVMCVAIDDIEFPVLKLLLDTVFGSHNSLGVAAVRSNPAGRSTPTGFSIAHDYAIFFGNTEFASVGRLPRSEKQLSRYDERDEKGPFEWVNFRKHGGAEATRSARPRMFYPIFVSGSSIRLPNMEWSEDKKSWVVMEKPKQGEKAVWPIGSEGEEKRWKWGSESVSSNLTDFCARPDQSGELGVYMKSRMNEEGALPLTWWDKKEYSATEYGTNLLTDMLGKVGMFSFPKALHLVEDCLRAANLGDDGIVLDFFGGSGTTAHAVLTLNQEDKGQRRCILVEVGTYFDTVLKPRVLKSIHSPKWNKGKPTQRDGGSSVMLKYIRLESYEDALNNLELKRTDKQGMFLDADAEMREQYILSYMLDVESRGSQSLLNVEAFRNPDEYKLRVERNGETQLVNVDLVETFNWLLGLTVKHIDVIRGVRVVEGTNPKGDRVLVLWRNIDQMDNDALDKWFQKQDYNTREMVYDLFYVNGDNNLENLRRPDQTWKVRLIEEEFQRLMFDVSDV